MNLIHIDILETSISKIESSFFIIWYRILIHINMSHALLIEAISTLHDDHDIQKYILRVYALAYHHRLLMYHYTQHIDDVLDLDGRSYNAELLTNLDHISLLKKRNNTVFYLHIQCKDNDTITYIYYDDQNPSFEDIIVYEFDIYRYLRNKYIKQIQS
jgi:hypothetical protein